MQRGEVWWADLHGASGRRPVVLVSRDAAYPRRTALTIVPITRTIYGIDTEVRLGPSDGMSADCVANADDVATIPKGWLLNRITVLTREKMEAIAAAIKFALALDEA